jgi:hypothetical protein
LRAAVAETFAELGANAVQHSESIGTPSCSHCKSGFLVLVYRLGESAFTPFQKICESPVTTC